MSIDAVQEPLTIEVFRESGWQAIVASTPQPHYALQEAFSSAARQANEAGETSKGNCLNLLGAVCSMMLVPDKFNEPFKPSMVFENRRTMIPSDLRVDQVVFLSQIVDEIDNYWLRARLADVSWLLLRPRPLALALTAIDCYTQSPLDADNLVKDGRQCWKRAIHLARNLGKGSGNRLALIEQALFAAFEKANATDKFLAIWLADLLSDAYTKHHLEIAQKLEIIAHHLKDIEDYYEARKYYSEASTWYAKAQQKSSSIKAAIAEADMLAQEGYARLGGEDPSHMVGVHFFEKAIQLYRAIPKAERVVYGVDTKITRLYEQLTISGQETLHELTTISSSFDITQFVNESREHVKGLEKLDALIALARIHRSTDKKSLREQTEKSMRENPLLAIFPSTVFSSDGRVIAKNSGLDLHGSGSEANEQAVLAAMIRDYTQQLGLIVNGCILPALQIIQLEHRWTEDFLVELCLRTPVIPDENAILLGRALYAGLESDYALALHLLIPQVESLVRFHLKYRGAKTTTLDADGIQTENGLSTLVDLPEMELAFGENWAFEIKALFCDSRGPNLRNRLAHGLLSDEDFYSVSVVYAWWFWLRIVALNHADAIKRANSARTE